MPSRKKAKGKARRAKGAAAAAGQPSTAAQAQNRTAPRTPLKHVRAASGECVHPLLHGLAEMSLGEKEEEVCDHGRSALLARAPLLLSKYEETMQRIFDNGIAMDPSICPLFVHEAIMCIFEEEGVDFSSDRGVLPFCSGGLGSGLVSLGANYIIRGRTDFAYPFSLMATATAITTTFLSMGDCALRDAKMKEMNKWVESETVKFLGGMSKCSCTLTECNHGRPDISMGDSCWAYMAAFQTALKCELGDTCDFADKFSKILEAGYLAHRVAYDQAIERGGEKSLDAATMKDIESCLLSLGTNFVLTTDSDSQVRAASVACALIMMDPKNAKGQDFTKGQDLMLGGPSEWARFFANRIGCSCLAARKKNEKNEQRMSMCWHCRTRKKRRELLTCQRCKMTDYCSAKCQAANWMEHKPQCDEIREGMKAYAGRSGQK